MWFRFTGTTITHKQASRQIITAIVSASETTCPAVISRGTARRCAEQLTVNRKFHYPDGQAAGTPGLAVPLTSGAGALPAVPPGPAAPVLMSDSTPGAAMGLATRKPCP